MSDENSKIEPVEPEQVPEAVSEDDIAEPVEPEQDAPDIDATPTQAPEAPEADAPKGAAGGAWSMPEPVFKKTSGYLPQGFEKQFTPAAPQGNEDTTAEHPKPEIIAPPPASEPAELAAVEPQPDVLEEGLLEPADFSEPPSPTQKKGVVGRILMILLALIIIGLMAAVLVAAIWFVLWPRPDATIN